MTGIVDRNRSDTIQTVVVMVVLFVHFDISVIIVWKNIVYELPHPPRSLIFSVGVAIAAALELQLSAPILAISDHDFVRRRVIRTSSHRLC
jgi:hypothetical protein